MTDTEHTDTAPEAETEREHLYRRIEELERRNGIDPEPRHGETSLDSSEDAATGQ